MCVRLLGALRGGSGGLQEAATAAGLDLKLPQKLQGTGRVLFELAWGDCACALATSKDGGERVAAFAGALLVRGARLQFLLFDEQDGPGRFDQADEPGAAGVEAPTLSLGDLARRGLHALLDGRAMEVGQ